MPDSSQILVTHPGRQHSHQLAVALQDAGTLAEYWTGVPARPLAESDLFRSLLSPLEKHPLLPLPDQRVRHNVVSPLARRIFEAVLPDPTAVDWTHRSMDWFDRWCANRIDDVDATAVVCYENSALHTFRAAKKRGWTTVLDAASYHHLWQDRHYEYTEHEQAHQRINNRKDREIEWADHILTVSELARESYIEAGIDPERVTSVPVGCDLDTFTASPGDGTKDDTPFTFIFAGHASERKGVDLLLTAASRLDREGLPFKLWFAGGVDERVRFDEWPRTDHLGYLSQDTLAARFREADCLVLPSRHDSFGMVVVEAMATGLPAIVSENVGAKEAITEGRSGWVVPSEDVEALHRRLHWCITHPAAVRNMSTAAREDARRYSWDAYRSRVVKALDSIVPA